jgi:hypothetical protein
MTSHGQISRGFPKNSLNFRFPHDHPFRYRPDQPRIRRVALLANYADKSKIRNTLAYEMIAAAGSISHFAFPVRLEKNGKFYSIAEMVEHGDGRWLERVGRDPRGALYKMYSNLNGPHGAEKKTRKAEPNRDLAVLAAALSESRPLEQRALYAYGHIDIPQCVSYFVAMTLISSDDHGHKNYYLYRDTRGSGEWALLPWDVDLSWGRNWTGQYFNETMFFDNPLDLYRNGRSKPRNRLYNLFFEYPEFREMYLRRLRTVMDEVLQAPGTPATSLLIEHRIRELVDLIDPPRDKTSDASLDQEAWPSWGAPRTAREEAHRVITEHLPGRRQFLFKSSRAQLFGDRIPASQPAEVALEIESPEPPLPPERQYVRLRNASPFAVDVSGWRLHGAGMEHQFRPGTVLPRGKAIFVTANATEFRKTPPTGAGEPPWFVQGNWKGTLTNGSTGIELQTKDGRRIARMR